MDTDQLHPYIVRPALAYHSARNEPRCRAADLMVAEIWDGPGECESSRRRPIILSPARTIQYRSSTADRV